jgi:hypothetical protein
MSVRKPFVQNIIVPEEKIQMSEDTVVEPVEEKPVDPEQQMKELAEELKKLNPSSPSFEQLKAWKQGHGDIYILPVSERVFIFRYLKHQEWVQMNASDSFVKLTPPQKEDYLFRKCVLFPVLDPLQVAGLPAGTMSMISEQIQVNSLFLDPAQVARLVIKI